MLERRSGHHGPPSPERQSDLPDQHLKKGPPRLSAASATPLAGALHLRTLQTIRDIAADPSEKIVLFLPSDISGSLSSVLTGDKKG